MEEGLVINQNLVIKGSELIISMSRSSGPGGQHVNKTSSKVLLRWSVKNSTSITDKQRARIMEGLSSRLVGDGELLIQVESERSQSRNKEIARVRLAEILRKALTPKKNRLPTGPTMGSKQRRIMSKKRRGLQKKLRKLITDGE